MPDTEQVASTAQVKDLGASSIASENKETQEMSVKNKAVVNTPQTVDSNTTQTKIDDSTVNSPDSSA
ncbi:hypothetical protein, partial [Enterococcus faecium]